MIRLLAQDPPVFIAPDKVYLAFADGRLTYDCVSCGSHCCRGHGYLLNSEVELKEHLSLSPHVCFFFSHVQSSKARNSLSITNFQPTCWFLDEEGTCKIHRERGYSAKPETCRLFPFNHIILVDKHLVVMPHMLCPLQVNEEDVTEVKSNHVRLLQDMSAKGITASIPEYKATRHLAMEPLFRLEQEICARAEQFLETCNYANFAAEQLALTGSYMSTAPAGMYEESCDAWAHRTIEQFVQSTFQLLDISPSSVDLDDLNLTHLMAVLTPFLRTKLVFYNEEHVSRTRQEFVDFDLLRVPHMLMATYIFALLAKTAGMSEITLQTIVRLFERYQGLFFLLSYADTVMAWKDRKGPDFSKIDNHDFRRQYAALFHALLPFSQKRQPSTLGELVMSHTLLKGVERTQFFLGLAEMLKYKVVPFDELKTGLSIGNLRTWAFHKLIDWQTQVQQQASN